MITIQMHRCAIGLFNLKYKRFKSKSKYCKSNTTISSTLLFLIFILINIPSSYERVSQVQCNKVMKSINGNISKNGTFFMMSWNKGNSKFSNKRDDISITLDRHLPNFFAIHEANFDINGD